MPEPSTATLPAVKAEAANACTSSAETDEWVGAKSELPSPVRKASAWASSSACVAGSASAAVASASHVGATHSESSYRVSLGEARKEERTSTKKALGAHGQAERGTDRNGQRA